MRFRKLRIAWSVFCGIACVLLIVLWVRSYWRLDGLGVVSFGNLMSAQGRIIWQDGPPPKNASWIIYTELIEGKLLAELQVFWRGLGFVGIDPSTFAVPHYFLLLTSVTLAAVPWIRHLSWRFSLRTLLIATTLVAVVLGLIVWLR